MVIWHILNLVVLRLENNGKFVYTLERLGSHEILKMIIATYEVK